MDRKGEREFSEDFTVPLKISDSICDIHGHFVEFIMLGRAGEFRIG